MDIVERLRDPNKWAGTSDSNHNPLPSHAMALEAADEIERLREALRKIGEGDVCVSLMTHPAQCGRAYQARAALKGDE